MSSGAYISIRRVVVEQVSPIEGVNPSGSTQLSYRGAISPSLHIYMVVVYMCRRLCGRRLYVVVGMVVGTGILFGFLGGRVLFL